MPAEVQEHVQIWYKHVAYLCKQTSAGIPLHTVVTQILIKQLGTLLMEQKLVPCRMSTQEDKRKQELAEMRQFDVRPMVAAADQKKEAKLARQKVYKDTPTSTSQVAATLPRVVAAPHSAEPAAKLSAKEQKAALKKLNKEKKKTPLVLGGAVYNAHPSRATAAAASDGPGVSGPVTSPTSAANTCTAQLSVQMPAAEITPAAATAVEAQVSAEAAGRMPDVLAPTTGIRAMEIVATTLETQVTAEPDVNISAVPATGADTASMEIVATAVMAEVPAANMATELVTAGESSAEAEVFEAEDMATAIPCDVSAVEMTPAQIPAADVTPAAATDVEAEVSDEPVTAAHFMAGVSEAVTAAEDAATAMPMACDISIVENTPTLMPAADVTTATAAAVEAEVYVDPVTMLATVPATAAHLLIEAGVSEAVTAAEDAATATPMTCDISDMEKTPAHSPATDVTSAVVTAVEAVVSAEPAGNMATVPATAADTSDEDGECEATTSAEDLVTPSPPDTSAAEITAARVSAADVTSAVEAEVAAEPISMLAIVPHTAAHTLAMPGVSGVVTSIKDSATPAINPCAAKMTEQIPAADITPAAATAVEAQVSAEPAANMPDVLVTAADISAVGWAEAVEANTVTCVQPTQTLLPVKIRLAGSSHIGTDTQVDTPDMGEGALAQSSPFSSAEGCASQLAESEHEELGSFPVDCSEYEDEELSTSQADVSEDKVTELSSHPVTDEEDESESDSEYEAESEFKEEPSSSRPNLVNR